MTDALGQAGSRPDDASEQERTQRNWAELLQELSVTQTGVQLLAGFLLTLPFQARFATLESYQEVVYLVVVLAAVLATGLLVAPVSFHRAVFRRQQKQWLVDAAHRSARTGLVLMALVSLRCGVADVRRGRRSAGGGRGHRVRGVPAGGAVVRHSEPGT